MRGTLVEEKPIKSVFGLTPACAGNTISSHVYMPLPEAHPRLCGEHTLVFYKGAYLLGSPPPVRGTLKRFLSEIQTFRLTPACAGNTACMSVLMGMRQAHPRLCGEHDVSGVNLILSPGSPPPVRGTLSSRGVPGYTVRLTPACAGNTAAGRRV